jgi:hypothetical protein
MVTAKMPNKTQKTKIIVDTSSWINVFRVDLTNYLIENFYIFMTPKIEEEILGGKGLQKMRNYSKNFWRRGIFGS